MLWNRIVGALTFRKGVYADVERDTSFTQTAWIIVAVAALLSQVGSYASSDIPTWLAGAVIGTIMAIIGFAVGALVISWVGKAVFKADVTFDEMVRTVGLAYVWQAVSVIGILGIIPLLDCLLAPIMIIAVVLFFVAAVIAAKEALDLDWLQTVVTIFLGWLAMVLITWLTNLILSLLGITASAIGGLF